jgi:hypothetical protein
MTIGHVLVRSILAGLFGLPVLAATAGMAQAQAEVVPFAFSEPLPTASALPECLDTTIGTQVGTESTVGQVVDTGTTFHAHGTSSLVYTVTFMDGRYVKGSSAEHFSFTVAGPVTVNTVTISEVRTIYSADQQPVGTVRIHAVSHITFKDADGNGQPDVGEMTANLDRFFFTCT